MGNKERDGREMTRIPLEEIIRKRNYFDDIPFDGVQIDAKSEEEAEQLKAQILQDAKMVDEIRIFLMSHNGDCYCGMCQDGNTEKLQQLLGEKK